MNVKNKFKLTSIALASAMAMGAMTIPTVASAEVTANLGISNMYYWRGQNLSPDGGVVSGGIDYSHDSGLYVGGWTTSENGGSETDLFVGFGGEAGGVSYDVSYWKYLYPEDGIQASLGDTDNSEAVLSVGYGPVSATAYINVESDTADDNWYEISGTFGDFNLAYGWADPEAELGDDYSYIKLGYAFNDDLSFGVSKASTDLGAGGVEESPLFFVSYGWSFDMKKDK